MRFLGVIAFAIVGIVVSGMPAVAAAKIKISYSFGYDRIRPEPQKNADSCRVITVNRLQLGWQTICRRLYSQSDIEE